MRGGREGNGRKGRESVLNGLQDFYRERKAERRGEIKNDECREREIREIDR